MNRYRITALALSALGAAVFLFFHLPLPFMLGPMAACLIAALAGAKLQSMGKLQPFARAILGVTIGTSITPETVTRIPDMALSVALVPVFITVIGLIGYPFFRRVCGYDHPTAFYSTMPGGLGDMLLLGEEAGGNVRTMSLIHATRVMVIVVLIPIILTAVWDMNLSGVPGGQKGAVPLEEIVYMTAAGLVGWRVAKRLRMFGAT
ncbi:MAG TPA: AbrB family transcriptional regulator, partial [Paracoccaceae bacterium]|nr:AbrB family transcriptional regulator [Paracoccaceae bacterium]